MNEPLTLSRAVLRPRRTRGYSLPYIQHQLVADLFPQRDDRGYLYRVVREEVGRTTVLVLSHDSPRDRFPEHDWGGVETVESKPYTLEIPSDTVLDYEMRINATRVVTDPDGRKRRVDVWDAVFASEDAESQSPHGVYGDYLARKLEGAAEVIDARVTERGQVRARRGNGGKPIQFIAANVIGTLRVTALPTLLPVMADGIGRSKAFGCGLLCLSRPGTILHRRYPQLSA